MPRIQINKQRCKGCELCIIYCPKACIELDKSLNSRGVKAVVFSEKDRKCTACGFCMLICPDVCIEVRDE